MLYKLLKFFGIIKNMPPQENQVAVSNFIIWLNHTFPVGPWIAIQGFTAVTNASFLGNQQIAYNPNLGYPLKAFLNTQTGEVKLFDARRFITNA